FSAMATAGADAKILQGQTLGGVNGAFQLPDPSEVLASATYGASADRNGTIPECASSLQQDCYAINSYYAVTKCDTDGDVECAIDDSGLFVAVEATRLNA